ncbi:hypothetical protein [Deefgea rivuli]|uniref:hypothetical protein n=1 Tax=Deefgea rivuli TaxID=400948 RepID=UPI000483C375|nr:hypothetical protein [Deefgea rivuli]
MFGLRKASCFWIIIFMLGVAWFYFDEPFPEPIIADELIHVDRGILRCTKNGKNSIGLINGIAYWTSYGPSRGYSGRGCYSQLEGRYVEVQWVDVTGQMFDSTRRMRFLVQIEDIKTGTVIYSKEKARKNIQNRWFKNFDTVVLFYLLILFGLTVSMVWEIEKKYMKKMSDKNND